MKYDDISQLRRAQEKLRRSREAFRELVVRAQSLGSDERSRVAGEIHNELEDPLLDIRTALTRLQKRLQQENAGAAREMRAIKDRLDTAVDAAQRIHGDLLSKSHDDSKP